MHVDGTVEGFQRLAFDHIHQLFTRQDTTGAIRHRSQQIELIRSHWFFLIVEAYHARIQIDFEAAETQHALIIDGDTLLASQYCPQPRQ